MKIRADRARLAEALTWVASALPKRPQMPVLTGIRLAAENGELHLSAFDYDVSHTARVSGVEVQDDGVALVAGQFIREVISSLKGAEVELVLDGDRLAITSGRSTYRLAVMDVAEYPALPTLPTVVGTADHANIAALVGSVEHAASRSPDLPTLGGVQLVGSERLEATATDRYRVARSSTAWAHEADFTANIPARALMTALKGMRGPMQIGCDGGAFGLADADRAVTVRTLAEDFPRLDRLFPSAAQITADVDAADLAECVKRVAMVSEGDFRIVRLSFGPAEIEVTADSDTSDGFEYVPCTSDGSISALFSGSYLAEALASINGARVELRFTDALKPVVVQPLDDDATTLLVMPRRAV